SGPEQGKVFDTSIFAVANDAVSYPKSIEYHARGPSASNYTTLAVHVGGKTPSSGYTVGSLSFIQVVTGFWQGLVGIAPNQTRAVIVPPNLGYGPTNPSCVATKPLSYTVPIVQTYSGPAFSKKYPGIIAATGAQFSDPRLGWPILILSANASFVTVENLPSVGWSVSPSGWPVDVTNITSTPNGTGQITLENQLFPSQAGLLVGKDYEGKGPCTTQSSGTFIVTAVNLLDGTYTENFNAEVQGQTLIFLVTVVNVFPGP
ncbi:MAG TPA: FKBP-type peptidyl-prolyl cis-trans isomerase, partial [Thermoplasmata archaeon]